MDALDKQIRSTQEAQRELLSRLKNLEEMTTKSDARHLISGARSYTDTVGRWLDAIIEDGSYR